jgi:hypothetical protein
MPAAGVLELMENSLSNRPAVPEVLYDDSLQQRRCNLGVPGSLRVHDNDWPVAADAETRRLTALDALRTEEQILALQKTGEQRIELAAPAIGRAETARTNEHVAGVRLHLRPDLVTHSERYTCLHAPYLHGREFRLIML